MSRLESEQWQAELLRILYRLRILDEESTHRLIDVLQVRLWERYSKSENQP